MTSLKSFNGQQCGTCYFCVPISQVNSFMGICSKQFNVFGNVGFFIAVSLTEHWCDKFSIIDTKNVCPSCGINHSLDIPCTN